MVPDWAAEHPILHQVIFGELWEGRKAALLARYELCELGLFPLTDARCQEIKILFCPFHTKLLIPFLSDNQV